MSSILVLGYELAGMSDGAVEARSARTWQFVQPLLEDGHQVCLVVSHNHNQFDIMTPFSTALFYHRVNLRRLGWLKTLKDLMGRFNPDGILAVTFNSCLRASKLPTDRPIWMDIYGSKLAEIQVAQVIMGSNRGYRTQLHHIRRVLKGGDVYSTCGSPQMHALVGQLGLASRLNRHTLGYQFVYPILPGAEVDVSQDQDDLTVRGDLIPEDAFILLWCGGYNVWTDIETLFQALTRAMAQNPKIVYLSAGAGVRIGQNDNYERFLAMIDSSPFRDRFVMLGWLPVGEIPAYYSQADVGINLDTFHYETILGTRTRMVEMMRYGLPVLTSLGCELSAIIQDQGLGLTFPIGDVESFFSGILKLSAEPGLVEILGKKALEYTTRHLSFVATTQPFRTWAKDPYHAPDQLPENRRIDIREIEYILRSVLRGILWQLFGLESGE